MSAIFNNLLEQLDMSSYDTSQVKINGQDPIFPTGLKIGEATAAVLAAQGLLLDEINRQRGGTAQQIEVDVAAAALSTKGIDHLRQYKSRIYYNDPLLPSVDFYRCRDSRYIFLHGGYPLLRDGILRLLDCPNDRERIAAKVLEWDSFALEQAIADKHLCGAAVRSYDEWLEHPQGQAIAAAPLVRIERIADGPPRPWREQTNSLLEDIKVLDFTHVIAGPTSAKCLASMGAEVLHVVAPSRPRIPPFEIDTNIGKLNCKLDLKDENDREIAHRLASQADVFIQSYRPGSIANNGMSNEQLASLNSNIITVDLSCYGHEGPWHMRAGFEQLAQTVTGMAIRQGGNNSPCLGPTYPNDYITGYLAAIGVLIALQRRAREGGAYSVKVSLCKTATWLQSFGEVDYSQLPTISDEYIKNYLLHEDGPLGLLTYWGNPLKMSATPLRYHLPTVPLGYHIPGWANEQADLRRQWQNFNS